MKYTNYSYFRSYLQKKIYKNIQKLIDPRETFLDIIIIITIINNRQKLLLKMKINNRERFDEGRGRLI